MDSKHNKTINNVKGNLGEGKKRKEKAGQEHDAHPEDELITHQLNISPWWFQMIQIPLISSSLSHLQSCPACLPLCRKGGGKNVFKSKKTRQLKNNH